AICATDRLDHTPDAHSSHQLSLVLDKKAHPIYFSRSAIPASGSLYFRHQGIYGYTRDLLLRFVRWKISALERAESLEQLRALENGVRIRVVMTGSGSPGVDTPEDAKAVAASLCEARDPPRNVGRAHVAHRTTATGRRSR